MPSLNLRAATIVASYEDLDMDVEAIAEHEDLEPETVEAILRSSSRKFRAEIKEAKEKADNSDDDSETPNEIDEATKQLAKETLTELMQYGDSDSVRCRAAKYLFDEAKGRNDVEVKRLKLLQEEMTKSRRGPRAIDIFNLHLQMAKEKMLRDLERQKQLPDSNAPKVIDAEVVATNDD